MYFLSCLTCLTIATHFIVSGANIPPPSCSTYGTPVKINLQPNNLQNSRRINVPVTVKLLPYEIAAGATTSYADISLTISNKTEQNIEFEVIRLKIVVNVTELVLMSSTPQKLQRPHQLLLKPGESKVLDYRLRSKSKIYKREQKVIAQIHYQIKGQHEDVVQSNPQAVAFMIP